MKKVIAKKDNSSPERKIALRKQFLPNNSCVLDLFCGNGTIYKNCYQNVKFYHGVDHEKVHTPNLCEISDNVKWVRRNDLSQYNVIDLDDYGVPWLLFFITLKKLRQDTITAFLTDGSPLHMKLTGRVSKLISATERTPKKFNAPGLSRFYLDIALTMLAHTVPKFGYEISRLHYVPNDKKTVYYWYLELHKHPVKSEPIHPRQEN